jgi:hypothetical protein
MYVELLDHLIKAWFLHIKDKPPVTDLLSLPTGANLLRDPVHEHIEEAMSIVGKLCAYDRSVKHKVCAKNQRYGYHTVEGIIDSTWV